MLALCLTLSGVVLIVALIASYALARVYRQMLDMRQRLEGLDGSLFLLRRAFHDKPRYHLQTSIFTAKRPGGAFLDVEVHCLGPMASSIEGIVSVEDIYTSRVRHPSRSGPFCRDRRCRSFLMLKPLPTQSAHPAPSRWRYRYSTTPRRRWRRTS